MKIEDYSKYYIQGSDHYLIPRDVFEELRNDYIELARSEDQLQNNWNELKKELKEKIDICDGCIDIMQTDLQEIAPRGNGKSYLTSEIFKNKVAKISFEFTLKHMQELEQEKEVQYQ